MIYRTSRAAAIERAIFPRLQTSPNQNGLMAKAACFLHWSQEDIRPYAEAMVAHARWLDQCLQLLLGTAINGGTDTHLLSFDVAPLGLTGLGAENMLMAARVFANRNQVPGDPNQPGALRESDSEPPCWRSSNTARPIRGSSASQSPKSWLARTRGGKRSHTLSTPITDPWSVSPMNRHEQRP